MLLLEGTKENPSGCSLCRLPFTGGLVRLSLVLAAFGMYATVTDSSCVAALLAAETDFTPSVTLVSRVLFVTELAWGTGPHLYSTSLSPHSTRPSC